MTFDLTESEAQRYDRQIRVWGAEAQTRIQTSKALICGMSKLNVEVVKNIVLAGVNLTIQDARVVSYDDLATNFFLNKNDIGKEIATTVLPKVKELNSFANVDCTTTPLESLDDSYFAQFSVVLMSGCSEEQARRVNALCRRRSPQAVFFWSDVFGEEGLFYSDFGDNFQYKEDSNPSSTTTAATTANATSSSDSSSSSSLPPPPPVKAVKSIAFPALSAVLDKSWRDIPRRFFPLDATFVKHRLLTKFRSQTGRNPTASDVGTARGLLQQFHALYQLDPVPGNDNGLVLADSALLRLCEVAGCVSMMACSVLGSFLSQEVIKAVSMTGAPALNVITFTGHDFVTKAVPIC